MPTAVGYASCSYELRQTGLTRPAYVTFGVDPSGGDALAVADAVFGAWSAAGSFRSIMDSTVTLTATRASLGTDGSGDLVGVNTTTSVGTASGAMVPPNVAVLIHKVTARGGRRGRGRMYIPWCTTAASVDETGVITPAVVSTITAAMLAWRLALSSAAVPLVLLHAPGQTALPPPDPVTGLTVDRIVATQRRRLGRT